MRGIKIRGLRPISSMRPKRITLRNAHHAPYLHLAPSLRPKMYRPKLNLFGVKKFY